MAFGFGFGQKKPAASTLALVSPHFPWRPLILAQKINTHKNNAEMASLYISSDGRRLKIEVTHFKMSLAPKASTHCCGKA